jgi:hypothetical protein
MANRTLTLSHMNGGQSLTVRRGYSGWVAATIRWSDHAAGRFDPDTGEASITVEFTRQDARDLRDLLNELIGTEPGR